MCRAGLLHRLPEPAGADGRRRCACLLPVPASQVSAGTAQALLRARGLYDPCLALILGTRAVGNDLDADGRELTMITGANQGGKSTFLRGLGLAQLMMQAGLFVAAE